MPRKLILALPYVIYNNKYFYWISIVKLSYLYYIINLRTTPQTTEIITQQETTFSDDLIDFPFLRLVWYRKYFNDNEILYPYDKNNIERIYDNFIICGINEIEHYTVNLKILDTEGKKFRNNDNRNLIKYEKVPKKKLKNKFAFKYG